MKLSREHSAFPAAQTARLRVVRARILALLSALLSVLLLASTASAQRGAEVVVDAPEGDAEDTLAEAALARRLRAELAARGYAAIARVPTLGDDPHARAEATLHRRVGGYVHVGPSSVEVCARRTPDGALRCEAVGRAAGDDLVVLQVVEVLRARLLGAIVEAPPVASEPVGPASVVEPTSVEPTSVEPTSVEPTSIDPASSAPRVELELALGASVPVDGTTPSLDGRLAVGVRLAPWVVRAWARLPFVASRAEADEGAAELVARTLGVDVAVSIDLGAPWAIELGLMVAGGWLTAVGEAMAPLPDATVQAAYALAGASVAARLELVSGLALVARLGGAWTLPTPVIRFGARDVASWGAPWLTADLALAATVP